MTTSLVLRGADGATLPLDPDRWHGLTTPAEHDLLSSIAGPVLDVGCGPGRIVEQLVRRGVVALGVDPAPAAVSLARKRGCPVLQRSVFERLPGEGRWRNVLLLDGNIGIGGDPRRLLRRCQTLAHPDGGVVAEVEPPGTGWRACPARLERGQQSSAWFAWAVVGADAIGPLADHAGLALRSVTDAGEGRWFAHLVPSVRRIRACA
jgi:SAM-dependent methyltransferase